MTKLTVVSKNTIDNLKPKCTVNLNNTSETFSDFIMVGYNMKDNVVSVRQNTDTITLGLAVKLVSKAFLDSYKSLSKEEQEIVDSVLKN